MPAKHKPQRRSSCPVGDRWSLLIIRDLMLRSYHTYKEFLSSDEGIATNILAERLQRLEAAGIVSTSGDADDRRKVVYRLTAKGQTELKSETESWKQLAKAVRLILESSEANG